MPGWSPEIANEFIRLANEDGTAFDQMQLQKLVYLAHGWCLASFDQPLTGDRPEAWEFGPVYVRLSEALAAYGDEPVTALIEKTASRSDSLRSVELSIAKADLDQSELDLVSMVYQDYGRLNAASLAQLTRHQGSPWCIVYADGRGLREEIAHRLIREQFVRYAKATDG